MDRRNLYKAGVDKLGNTAAKIKRKERANEDRTLRRNELFQKVRHTVTENEVQLEHTAKISKREAYLRRYEAWKAEKDKQRQEERKNKPKPFCSAVSLSFAPKDHQFQPPAGLKRFPLSGNKVCKSKQNEKEIQRFRKPLEPVDNAISAKKGNIKSKVSKKLPEKEPRKVLNSTKLNNLRHPKIKVAALQNEETSSMKLKAQTPREKACPQNSFITRFTSTTKKIVPTDREQFCEDDIISPIENDAAECVAPPQEEPEKMGHLSTVKNNSTVSTQEKQLRNEPQERYKVLSTPPDENFKVDLNVTPVCDNDKPPNYMSPFVTISRGKVSTKKEKEKRESIYKLEISSPGEPIHVRRARESVKYFRTVLNNEIARLLNRCKFWESYRTENLSILEECGLDMINVTIGQTKLLTSKKLEQFRELIDRCEAHVVVGSLSGSLQSVLPEDLEGFWSMVRLQVDNVDKRFENLERWKANEWCDPDETKLKTKKNLSKVTKTKTPKPIKSNDVLKELLKKAQAAYKKSRKDNSCVDTDIIIMGKKRRSSTTRSPASNIPIRRSKRLETPKRLDSPKQSIGAHNVTPYSRRSTLKRNSCETCSPRRVTSGKPSLLMNALSNSHARKSMNRTPQAKPRKSILKTPGTTRNKRAVFFNDELDYKSPEAFSSEKSISGIKQTPDEMQRSLHLRSRRIILRPDEEIDIPRGT